MGKVYEVPERVVIIRDNSLRLRYYKLPGGNIYRREIKKPDGRIRLIFIPDKAQRKIMRKIARQLTRNYKHFVQTRRYKNIPVYGFTIGGNVVDAAIPHCGCRYSLSVDIVDFFHNCKLSRAVENYHNVMRKFSFELIRRPLLSPLSFDFADNKFISPYDFENRTFSPPYNFASSLALPQGFPTSPILSNFAFLENDIRIWQWAMRNNVVYTRYADDMVFSFNDKSMADEVLNYLKECLKEFSLCKVKLQDVKEGRKHILGLAVDEHGCHITRAVKRRLRFMMKFYPESNQTKGLLSWKKFVERKNEEWAKSTISTTFGAWS